MVYVVGMFYKNIYIIGCGDVLEYKNKCMSVVGIISVENVMIDGLGIGDIGNIVLCDWKILLEDGIFVVVVIISWREKKIILKF